MKRNHVRGAIIGGFFAVVLTSGQSVYAQAANDPFQFREELDRPPIVQQHDPNKLSAKDGREIKFTVRAFLWALDHEQPIILAKVASQKMKRQFPNAAQMLVTMLRAHKPIVGLKSIFYKNPKIQNGTVSQEILFEDKKGNAWQAIYFLNRSKENKPAGKFGVVGCLIKKLKGKFS